MKRRIRLTENDLNRIVKSVLAEGAFNYDKASGRYLNKTSPDPHREAGYIGARRAHNGDNWSSSISDDTNYKINRRGEVGEDYDQDSVDDGNYYDSGTAYGKATEIFFKGNAIEDVSDKLYYMLEDNLDEIVGSVLVKNGHPYWKQLAKAEPELFNEFISDVFDNLRESEIEWSSKLKTAR